MFLAVNVVGLFVHNLMEHAQRRAFLDTRYESFSNNVQSDNVFTAADYVHHRFRNCIAARLEMEDENEKLVSKR